MDLANVRHEINRRARAPRCASVGVRTAQDRLFLHFLDLLTVDPPIGRAPMPPGEDGLADASPSPEAPYEKGNHSFLAALYLTSVSCFSVIVA
jgi:hypothetical protein